MGVLATAWTLLAIGAFLRRGGMAPPQGAVFLGLAVLFAAEFIGAAGRRVVIAVRVLGMAVALAGFVLVLA